MMATSIGIKRLCEMACTELEASNLYETFKDDDLRNVGIIEGSYLEMSPEAFAEWFMKYVGDPFDSGCILAKYLCSIYAVLYLAQ